MGDGMASWKSVFEPLSSLSQVFAYSRPGYDLSDDTARPRTPNQIVDDLRRVLSLTGNRPPYLLVGHSLGGIYMLRFAELYPDEVAGMVLLDARHPMFTKACLDRELAFCDLPSVIRPLLPSHVLNEHDAVQDERMPATLGDTPLVVISQGRIELLESKSFQALWHEMQVELSELSSRSRYVIAEDAGHYIHQEAPELLLQGVQWVLEQTRQNRNG